MCEGYLGVACFCRDITTENVDSMFHWISAAMVNKRIETNNISRTHWNSDSVGGTQEVKKDGIVIHIFGQTR
jgi:hypothetical protein